MCVARCEIAIRVGEIWILLDRQEEARYRLIEASTDKIRTAERGERRTNPGSRAETQRGLDVLYRNLRLASPAPKNAAAIPSAGKARISANARSINIIMAPMSSPK